MEVEKFDRFTQKDENYATIEITILKDDEEDSWLLQVVAIEGVEVVILFEKTFNDKEACEHEYEIRKGLISALVSS